MVWCGLNSIGVVEFVDAARRIGATAAPLKYRLSDDGAAYVTDHSGAGLAYVDVGGNV
jgi:fatty-acyl-CoA synthase/long-chain acyl-CoA synthetase